MTQDRLMNMARRGETGWRLLTGAITINKGTSPHDNTSVLMMEQELMEPTQTVS